MNFAVLGLRLVFGAEDVAVVLVKPRTRICRAARPRGS